MRNLGLDLLRCAAVFLVLGRHIHPLPEGHSFLRVWWTGGWVGVDIFFVLSGFLVSGLLFREFHKEGQVDVKRFLIRRGLKIYPAFYVFLLAGIAVRIAAEEPVPLLPVLGELLFLQNYVGGLWWHTWSLAVEEHFYIGIALLVVFLLSRKSIGSDPFAIIPAVFVAVASACLVLRIVTWATAPAYSHDVFLFPTHLRIDSLMFGVFLSYLWHFRDLESRIARVPSSLLALGGIVLIAPAFALPLERYPQVSVFGVVAFYSGAGLLLLAMVRITSSKNPLLRFAGTLGRSSYSMYLWHMPVNLWGRQLLARWTGDDSLATYLAVYFVGTIVVGVAMSKLVEWPVLRLRDRLFPPRGGPAPVYS